MPGCDAPIASFKPNWLYAKRMEMTGAAEMAPAVEDAHTALTRLFGKPDDPKWPKFLLEDESLASLVDVDRLRRAAGPVSSDEAGVHYGLYREHCMACHGVTGNGRGPTSRFLNPYPRDFRLGKFKFKATPIGSKPTRLDLERILRDGIVGTSMPSFGLLNEEDLQALIDYVIYLSVRGEVERRLLAEAAFEIDLEAGDRLFDAALEEDDPEAFALQWQTIEDHVVDTVRSWAAAPSQVTEVDGPPVDYPLFGRDNAAELPQRERLAASIANGRRLYQGQVAGCAQCHGATAMGDGQTNDFDQWTKDWTTLAGIDPKDKAELAPMLALGALRPRNIAPRNLRRGIYRGGSRPIDLYFRIVNGIDGTSMPAAPMRPDNPLGMTEDEVWDLVNYLLSLPYEHLAPESTGVVTSAGKTR